MSRHLPVIYSSNDEAEPELPKLIYLIYTPGRNTFDVDLRFRLRDLEEKTNLNGFDVQVADIRWVMGQYDEDELITRVCKDLCGIARHQYDEIHFYGSGITQFTRKALELAMVYGVEWKDGADAGSVLSKVIKKMKEWYY